MTLMEGLARQTTWAARNTVHNLKLLPVDKLGWKPAPTANSALEIVNHLAYWLFRFGRLLDAGEWVEPEFTRATDLPSAIALITASAEQYAAVLQRTAEADMWRMVRWRQKEVPFAEVAMMPMLDVIHHHGQIAYLQALLGDGVS
jgi:uncharacterized damage-inducible protein DinB